MIPDFKEPIELFEEYFKYIPSDIGYYPKSTHNEKWDYGVELKRRLRQLNYILSFLEKHTWNSGQWAEKEFFTESFYLFAFRLLDLIEKNYPEIKVGDFGKRKHRLYNINRVRNLLITHPKGVENTFNSFGWKDDKGPVVKPHGTKSESWIGLFEDAEILRQVLTESLKKTLLILSLTIMIRRSLPPIFI